MKNNEATRMKNNEAIGFAWAGVFFVTAVLFFVFSLFVRLLDGTPAHMKLFFIIGCVAVGFGLCGFLSGLSAKHKFKKVN